MTAPARDPRPGLAGLERSALEAWLTANGEKAFRARQISDAVWAGTATGPGEVSTLPRELAARLAASFRWTTLEDEALVLADGGQTEKALHRLSDGATIESVLMHYPARAGRRARHTL